MATVRIYKVAELLNTSSQDVIALLKKEHGIEVKSASSTIEEVVAREFVVRQARQRGLTRRATALDAVDDGARGSADAASPRGRSADRSGSAGAAAPARARAT